MLGYYFASPYRRFVDQKEVNQIVEKYGNEAQSVVRGRAENKSLSKRDRNHWKRISWVMAHQAKG